MKLQESSNNPSNSKMPLRELLEIHILYRPEKRIEIKEQRRSLKPMDKEANVYNLRTDLTLVLHINN